MTMTLLAVVLSFLSVTLLIGLVAVQISPSSRRTAVGRLRERPISFEESIASDATAQQGRRGGWRRFFGSKAAKKPSGLTVVGLRPDGKTAAMLLHAGYRSARAVRMLHFSRMFLAIAFMIVPMIFGKIYSMPSEITFLLISFLGMVGYLMPKIYVRIKARRRQHRLRLSLPDALDLLVVCVEAGMGLNQAIVKVSEELRVTHPEIADEFRLVNLEIAAGRTRTEALRSLGERTGVDDIISLAAMIIQTDKFGTSIARSLRVHSDCLRTERRQRAEEAAAKTTIKLIFPLLFCVFPALFVVVLAPAAIHLWDIFGGAGEIRK